MAVSAAKFKLLEKQNTSRLVVPSEYEIEKYKSAVIEEVIQKSLYIKPHEWTEYAFLMLDKDDSVYKNFSFDEREYWIPIYNSGAKNILCKTGRQVAKSTFLGNRALTYCCLQVGFHVLYVSPSQMQTKEFLNTRIKAPLRDSYILQKWEDRSKTDNTFTKEFLNNSKINFRYAFLNADRIRGLSGVDCLVIDEIQDIHYDNIPVIEQTAFVGSNKYKLFLYSGTPKSLDNPIEDIWANRSSQNEWAIPCWRHSYHSKGGTVHGYWNIIVDEKNIGLKGLICEKCGELINPRDKRAYWVQMNPSVWDPKSGVPLPFEGYHIPQLIAPDGWKNWQRVLQNRSQYPRNKFYNEVLGISFDSGEKPISRQDLIDNCDDNVDVNQRLSTRSDYLDRLKDIIFDGRQIWAGVDWSGGSDRSLTALTLATYIQMGSVNYFVPFFWRKFTGPEAEPTVQERSIINICKEWRVNRVASDWGGGFFPNDHLARELGASRIVKYQYGNPKMKMKWEPNLGRFIIHRSECMTSIFTAIKRRNVFKFPRWDEFEEYGTDFLSIFSEYNDRTRMLQYHHNPNIPDDCFHALLLCFLGSMIDFPRRDILVPDSTTAYSEDYQPSIYS